MKAVAAGDVNLGRPVRCRGWTCAEAPIEMDLIHEYGLPELEVCSCAKVGVQDPPAFDGERKIVHFDGPFAIDAGRSADLEPDG